MTKKVLLLLNYRACELISFIACCSLPEPILTAPIGQYGLFLFLSRFSALILTASGTITGTLRGVSCSEASRSHRGRTINTCFIKIQPYICNLMSILLFTPTPAQIRTDISLFLICLQQDLEPQLCINRPIADLLGASLKSFRRIHL